MTTNKIPQSDSIQELAQFWDTHDVTDFEGELQEVAAPVFECETAIMIHLSSQDAEVIKEIANSKGIGDAELIRGWSPKKSTAFDCLTAR